MTLKLPRPDCLSLKWLEISAPDCTVSGANFGHLALISEAMRGWQGGGGTVNEEGKCWAQSASETAIPGGKTSGNQDSKSVFFSLL